MFFNLKHDISGHLLNFCVKFYLITMTSAPIGCEDVFGSYGASRIIWQRKKKEDSCLCTYIGKIILRKNNSDLPQDLSSFVLVLSKYTKFLKNDTRN